MHGTWSRATIGSQGALRRGSAAMQVNTWIEIVAAAAMLVGLIGVFAIRWRLKKGIGRRAIQAMTLILVVPSILILGLEGRLVEETVAAVLGAAIGYGLSGGAAKDANE
jgi:hypothetical protein